MSEKFTVCKYCGQDATGRVDQYEEYECENCANFFAIHPEPPIPAPAPLINLQAILPTLLDKKEKK